MLVFIAFCIGAILALRGVEGPVTGSDASNAILWGLVFSIAAAMGLHFAGYYWPLSLTINPWWYR